MRHLWVFCALYFSLCAHCFSNSVLSDLAGYVDFFAKQDAVISKNIANASTPGYIALELQKSDRTSISLSTTNPLHMDCSSDNRFEIIEKRDSPTSMDGNSVDLQKELIQKDKNAAAFKNALHIYSKARSLTKLAADDK
ncbi:flagellar basal body rod protein FlgB [Candidatus Cyrtobacter comes]|uniref:Flagellar basal body rod protein FlgB n=1 Tax=Candidatus Cyrtobacter comes TaxID=675776 RepID=A0ABU5L9L8_9RICK|nr:hypothetical protein [Candidatus Cyrtobacter comes]MDZ5762821.1 flagellar basal body rod protein FlgB [Candidatus Cyrtobacter comes]